MPRPLDPLRIERDASAALTHLRQALTYARGAGAVKTAARIRHAISSAKGAVRAAGYRRSRLTQPA